MTHPETTTPANPAQGVSEAIDKAVVEALSALHMEHAGRAYDILHNTLTKALTAAIGAGRSSEPEFEIAPDNGTPAEVLAYVLDCARRWVPEARIIGNARAGDIERAIAAIGAGGQAVAIPEKPTLAMRIAYDELNNSLGIDRFANFNLVWEKIRSHIPANPPAQPGWRDMSSAPKDGTRILLSIGYKTVLARWYDPWSNWQCGDIPADPAREEYHGIGSLVPNGWMPAPIPLPASPQPGDA